MFENILKAKMKICKYSRNDQKSYDDALRWPNTVFKCLCLIHRYFQTIYALAPVFCKSQGYPQK